MILTFIKKCPITKIGIYSLPFHSGVFFYLTIPTQKKKNIFEIII